MHKNTFNLKTRSYIYILLLAFPFLHACKATRLIENGSEQSLVVQAQTQCKTCKDFEINTEDLDVYIRQLPNRKLLGFPVYLYLYNYAHINGKAKRWKTYFSDRMGEEPVIHKPRQTHLTVSQMQMHMRNQGFYRSSVSVDSVKLRKKKVKIKYSIKPGVRYNVDSVSFIEEANTLLTGTTKLDSIAINMQLFKQPFATHKLDAERNRVARGFQNNGYYRLLPYDFYYVADTLAAFDTQKVNHQ